MYIYIYISLCRLRGCGVFGGGCRAQEGVLAPDLIPQKLFKKPFGKSSFSHKSVNLSCIITDTKNNLTDL